MTEPELQVMADFNGLFGDLLCLSHEDSIKTRAGVVIELKEGMTLTAWEENYENDKRDDLLASGIVERSPEQLACRGSRWVLRIDQNGVRWESDTNRDEADSI